MPAEQPTPTTSDRSTDRLIYSKWGTRIASCDEGSESLITFVFDGVKATAAGRGWKLLEGTFERVPAGVFDGEDVFAYLWPVAQQAGDRA